MAEDGLRAPGHRAQPLLEQGDVQARGRYRRRRQIVREQRGRRVARLPGRDPGFADYNFWGRSRNNITNYRQTQFVVNLMNGTHFGTGRSAHEPHARAVTRRPVPRRRRQRGRLRRPDRDAAAEQLLRLRGHRRSRSPSRYLFDDKVEDAVHDVRGVAVHQGRSGVPVGRQGHGAGGVS